MRQREDELCTSAFTVGEFLTGPIRQKVPFGIDRVRTFFRAPWVRVLPFTESAAYHYAHIRARLRVSPADAIHLACAAEAGTDVFITNEAALISKSIPGIQFIVGLDTDLF